MPALVVATHNPAKLSRIAEALGTTWRLRPFDASDAELAASRGYEEAATAKAHAARCATRADMVLAHDCGFEFACLGWKPGAHTGRWLATDAGRAQLRALVPGSEARLVHCAVVLSGQRTDVLWESELLCVRKEPLDDGAVDGGLSGLPLTRLVSGNPRGLDLLLQRVRDRLEDAS